MNREKCYITLVIIYTIHMFSEGLNFRFRERLLLVQSLSELKCEFCNSFLKFYNSF
jgi:hypothetical protein